MDSWSTHRAFKTSVGNISVFICPSPDAYYEDQWDVFIETKRKVTKLPDAVYTLCKHPENTYLHFDNGFLFHNGHSEFGTMLYNGFHHQIKPVQNPTRYTVRMSQRKGLRVRSKDSYESIIAL